MNDPRDTEIQSVGDNVFAAIDVPDAEGMKLKAGIVVELRRLIEAHGLTQVAAAKRIGIGQADLSKILRGSFRGLTIDRLMRMLTAFDQDVEIVSRPRSTGKGHVTFRAEAV